MRQNRRNAPQYWPRHVNHRFDRLEDLGLIVITRAEHGRGRREPPKVAELAGLARRGIERGLLYDLKEPNDEAAEDILAELRALRETDERLEQRIDAMDESVSLVDTTFKHSTTGCTATSPSSNLVSSGYGVLSMGGLTTA